MNNRVIIVDDEPWTREVIKRFGNWEELGLQVLGEASDGITGLHLVEQLNPDIIITDMCMPDMDGAALMQALYEKQSDIKIIVVSGYDKYSYVREAIKYKAMDYLLKPVNPEELNKLLKKCVEELQEKNKKENVIYEPEDFITLDWVPDYIREKRMLEGYIKDLNLIATERVIDSIRDIIISNEGVNVSINIIIKIYYDLIWMLEKYCINLGYSMEVIFKENPGEFAFCVDSSFVEMINYVKTLYLYAINNINKLLSSRNKINMNEIQKYVDSYYMNNITLESVADHFYISKEYLSKMFKIHTKMNFSYYITEKRMKKAKELIVEQGIKIKNVAELVGYVDITHFYKKFKKYYGITPGEMREKIKLQ